MWFLNFVTVFNYSYNCQNSPYLGRNRVFKPFLIFLCYNSLGVTECFKKKEPDTKIDAYLYFLYSILAFLKSLFWDNDTSYLHKKIQVF